MDELTGKKYKVNISFKKVLLIELLLPLSYILYGLVIISVLSLAGLSKELSLIMLTIAYIINIPISLSKKLSFVERIQKCLTKPLINSIFVSDDLKNDGSVFTDIEDALSFSEIIDLCKEINKRLSLGFYIRRDAV